MEFITLPFDAAAWSARMRRQSARIGFVPTMGALHKGHLELVRQALSECDVVACSIFVNPLQFNDLRDLERYPRQLAEDRALLEQAGCHALFAPERMDIFADLQVVDHDLGGLDRHWEGPSRPGHFQGVVNVVERLFFYVRPDRAYFGLKDYQQLAIIRHVAQKAHWPEVIVPSPTVRDADGLALSSRNQRLSADERKRAVVLHRALQAAARQAALQPVASVRQAALEVLASEPEVKLDYLGIVHPDTLDPLHDHDPATHAVALIAAQVGPVRLIDNLLLHQA